jgi:hypothetical protein
MLKCKTTTTHMSTTDKITVVDCELLSSADATEYRSTVGGLQYLMLSTEFVSIYMRLTTLIGLLLSAYRAIYDSQCLMGCIFVQTPLGSSRRIQM